MPLLGFQRLISGSTVIGTPRTFVPLDRPTAIAEALAGAGTIATNVARVPQWPQLLPYTYLKF